MLNRSFPSVISGRNELVLPRALAKANGLPHQVALLVQIQGSDIFNRHDFILLGTSRSLDTYIVTF